MVQIAWDLGFAGSKMSQRSERSCIFIASDDLEMLLPIHDIYRAVVGDADKMAVFSLIARSWPSFEPIVVRLITDRAGLTLNQR
jgi:hypothetical protein